MLNRSVAGRGLFRGLPWGRLKAEIDCSWELLRGQGSSLLEHIHGVSNLGRCTTKELARLRTPLLELATSFRDALLKQNPERAVDALAVILAAGVAIALSRIEIGSGDYGQWLMLSRYYMGQDIPDYREVSSVPPLMPFSLAALRVFVHDPFAALQVFRCFVVVALTLSFYAAATAVFRSRTAGILASVYGILITDRLLELFSFGGLPQLCSLVCLNLGVAAFGRASSQAFASRWWWVGNVLIALAAFSHTGTGLIAIVAGVLVFSAAMLRCRPLTWAKCRTALFPTILMLVVVGLYLLVVILPENREYAQNPASLSYRGPDRIWPLLTGYRPNLFIIAAGLAMLVVGCCYEICRWRPGPFLSAGAFALAPLAICAFSIITKAATDYPRFVAPIMMPLAITLGGGIATASTYLGCVFRDEFRKPAVVGIPILIAVLLAASVGVQTMGAHSRESAFYKASHLTNLAAVGDMLEGELTGNAAILTTAREGKWIEGLTGKECLFAMPTRYSFRTKERARSIAADTLLRSTTSLSNEYFFVKYVDSKNAQSGSVPRQPWISANHQGEYMDLVRLLPTECAVIAGDSQGGVLATLNSLYAKNVEVTRSEDLLEFSTRWDGERRGGVLSYTSTMLIPPNSKTIHLIEEVVSSVPIQAIEVQIRPTPGMNIVGYEVMGDYVDLIFPENSAGQPVLRIHSSEHGSEFEALEEGILIRSSASSRLHLELTILTAGSPIYQTDYLEPAELVDRYGVEAVILMQGSSLEPRMARLALLGFQKDEDMSVGEYVVLRREVAGA